MAAVEWNTGGSSGIAATDEQSSRAMFYLNEVVRASQGGKPTAARRQIEGQPPPGATGLEAKAGPPNGAVCRSFPAHQKLHEMFAPRIPGLAPHAEEWTRVVGALPWLASITLISQINGDDREYCGPLALTVDHPETAGWVALTLNCPFGAQAPAPRLQS